MQKQPSEWVLIHTDFPVPKKFSDAAIRGVCGHDASSVVPLAEHIGASFARVLRRCGSQQANEHARLAKSYGNQAEERCVLAMARGLTINS